MPLPYAVPDWPKPPIPSELVPALLELAERDVAVLRAIVVALALTLGQCVARWPHR